MPYTLLLADDSVTIQRVIELTFADEDVTVVAVSDGDQAIERLEASPPDIVLADIGMPGKNGYEVAQYMRRSPKLSHIPVVLLTGAFEPVDQARANDAGCDGVLAKPFEPQLVIGRVKELLARSRRGSDGPVPEANLQGVDAGGFSTPPPLATPSPDNIWAPPLGDQRPATPFVDPPIPDTPAGPVPRTELNDYFDRLDAAFSTLTSGAPAPSPAPVMEIGDPPAAKAESDIDWFGAKESEAGSTEPWDLPMPHAGDAPADFSLSAPEPETAVSDALAATIAAPEDRLSPIEESTQVESFAAFTPSPAAAHAPSAAPALELPLPNAPRLPALADAFAALLAAEQGETPPAAEGLWPAASAQAAVDDQVIEDVVRRVLERLSDTVVRDAVADVASKVAERLVLEEIARIKASIK